MPRVSEGLFEGFFYLVGLHVQRGDSSGQGGGLVVMQHVPAFPTRPRGPLQVKGSHHGVAAVGVPHLSRRASFKDMSEEVTSQTEGITEKNSEVSMAQFHGLQEVGRLCHCMCHCS